MKIKLILCDYDGVLYNFDKNKMQEGLYCNVKNTNPELSEKIKNFLFGQEKFIFNAWMRGYVDHNDLHVLMASKFGTNIDYLNKELLESVKTFVLNWELINFISNFRNTGAKVHIVTDNITTFSDFIVPYFNLLKYFDKTYSSSDFHIVKADNENEWVKNIIEENKCSNGEVLFIDDNPKLLSNLNNIGVNTYLYNSDTRLDFEKWFIENIGLNI